MLKKIISNDLQMKGSNTDSLNYAHSIDKIRIHIYLRKAYYMYR